jgi:hypothetical protein
MEPNVDSIIRNHTTLAVECIDRLYLNGYLPTMQTSGQLCHFLGKHRGNPVPSPALLKQIREGFLGRVDEFLKQNAVPKVEFKHGQRKDDIANARRRKFDKQEGVVFLGVAQEKASSFKAQKGHGPQGGVRFDFLRQPVFVNHLYFYVQDRRWGPAFFKIGTYAPFPLKLCLNGHEWAKQRLREEKVPFESLDNGVFSCADPQRLQKICDSLGPADVQDFYDRWSKILPWPLLPEDRAAGYEHKLSIWQLEVSLTHIFDNPLQGRLFFDELIRDNLDLGRPDRVSLAFGRKITKRTPPPQHGYRTRVITSGVDPSIHVSYKHSDHKQYFKLGRGGRGETTINNPHDFGSKKGLENLIYLRDVGRSINRRVLTLEQVSQNCVLSQEALDRLQMPTFVPLPTAEPANDRRPTVPPPSSGVVELDRKKAERPSHLAPGPALALTPVSPPHPLSLAETDRGPAEHALQRNAPASKAASLQKGHNREQAKPSSSHDLAPAPVPISSPETSSNGTTQRLRRASGLRFADPRVMALLQAIVQCVLALADFRNADIRARVAALLGLTLDQYTPSKMTYDLRRLADKGLIKRVPRTNRYRVTSYGVRAALFVSKVHLRILRPGAASLEDIPDDIPRDLRTALAAVDTEILRMCEAARLRSTA